ISDGVDALEQKILGATFEEATDYATLEELSDAIKAIGSSSGSDVSALAAKIGAPAVGQTAASGLYGMIADLQSQIDNIVKPDLVQRNELNNLEELDEYDSTFIRAELGRGDDTLNSSDANTEILGGWGADKINLTYLDASSDTVSYESAFDGRTFALVNVTFDATQTLYREGTVLTLRVNGTEYSYTVATDEGETPEVAVNGLGQVLVDANGPVGAFSVDVDTAVVLKLAGVAGAALDVSAGGNVEPAIDNAGLVTEVDVAFSSNSADWPTATNNDNVTVFDRELRVNIDGKVVTANVVYDQDGDADPVASVAALQAAVTAATAVGATTAIAPATVNLGVVDALSSFTNAEITVTAHGVTHTVSGEKLGAVISFAFDQLSGSGLFDINTFGIPDKDVGLLIDVQDGVVFGLVDYVAPGEPGVDWDFSVANNVITVTALTSSGDFLVDALKGAITSEFDGQVNGISSFVERSGGLLGDLEALPEIASAEINDAGELVVTAEVRGDDPAANGLDVSLTVDEGEPITGTAPATGGSLNGVIAEAIADGTTLTLRGDVVVSDDADAPTFKVNAAEVDQNGAQQETVVSFSADDADYFEGGTLSVEINGVTVSAPMVAGSALQSIARLSENIQATANGGDVYDGIGQPTVYEFFLTEGVTADTALNTSSVATELRYSATFEINAVSYANLVYSDGQVLAGGSDHVSDGTAATVGTVLEELNAFYTGVATFSIGQNGNIRAEVAHPYVISDLDGTDFGDAPTSLFGIYGASGANLIVQQDVDYGVAAAPSVVEKVQIGSDTIVTVEADPALAVLESSVKLDNTYEIAQATASTESLNGSVSFSYTVPQSADTASGIYIADDTAMPFGGGGVYYSIDTSLERIAGTHTDNTGANADVNFVRFDTMEDFILSLKLNGDPIGQNIRTDYGAVYNSGDRSLVISNTEGGPDLKSVDLVMDFGVRDVGPVIRLTAVSEGADPIKADASMSYQGDQQTAVIKLDGADTYTSVSDGTASSRGADVYYQGGQAHLTLTPKDGAPVTVSVDMAEPVSTARFFFERSDGVAITEDMAVSGTGRVIFNGGLLQKNTNFEGTVADFLVALETNPYVATAQILDGKIVTTPSDAILQAESSQNFIAVVSGDSFEIGGTSVVVEGLSGRGEWGQGGAISILSNTGGFLDPSVLTSEAIVDAVNLLAQGAVFDYGQPLSSEMLLNTTASGIKKLTVFVGVQQADGSLFTPTAAEAVLNTSAETAVTTVGELLGYLNGVYAGHATWSLTDGGDLAVTPDSATATLVRAYDGAVEDALMAVSIGLDNDGTPATAASTLVQWDFLEGASYDADSGAITLTAADHAKESFTVSDVSLDYAGVRQIAKLSSGSDSTHSVTYTDGSTPDDTSYGRGANIYYEGGKVYATITPTTGDPVTVSADMVASSSYNIGGSGSEIVAGGTLTLRGGAVKITDADNVTVTYDLSSGSDDPQFDFPTWIASSATSSAYTVETVIEWFEALPGVKTAALDTSGRLILTADDGYSIAPAGFSMQFDGGDNYGIGVVDHVAETRQALADAIQAKLDPISDDFSLTGLALADPITVLDLMVTVNEVDTLVVTLVGSDPIDLSVLVAALDGIAGISASYSETDDLLTVTGDAATTSFSIKGSVDVGGSLDVDMGATSAADSLIGVIASVEVNGSDITLTAAQDGTSVFTVSGTADYQGQTQIATASYSTDASDYYDGGTVSMVFNTNPVGAGTDVTVTAAMQPAVNKGTFTWVGTFEGSAVYLDGSENLNLGANASFLLKAGPTELEKLTYQEPVTLTSFLDDVAALDSVESAEIVGGQVVFTLTDAVMAANNNSIVWDVDGDWSFVEGAALYSGGKDIAKTGVLAVTVQSVSTAAEATAQALVEAINAQVGTGGTLDGVAEGATLDATTNTITVTSASNTEHAFDISSATVSYGGVKQEAQLNFSTSEADYYAGGKLYATVAGTEYSADMVAGKAADSVAALAAKITAAMAGPAVYTLTGGTDLVGRALTESSLLDGGEMRVYVNGGSSELFSSGSETTVGDFLTFLTEIDGIEKAELVNGDIVVTSSGVGSQVSLAFSG
uniref:hypothetical protein n=1 Tax=Sulfitobacter sp. TaxID=1903071 RepID=UPI003F6CC37A